MFSRPMVLREKQLEKTDRYVKMSGLIAFCRNKEEKSVIFFVRSDGFARMGKMVGMARFELATFCPPDKRANQAALHPDRIKRNVTPISEKSSRFLFFFQDSRRIWYRSYGPGEREHGYNGYKWV